MPSRILSYEKIVKGESRGKWKTKFSIFDYAEPTPVFYKDSERRAQSKDACIICLAEPHPVLSKFRTVRYGKVCKSAIFVYRPIYKYKPAYMYNTHACRLVLQTESEFGTQYIIPIYAHHT